MQKVFLIFILFWLGISVYAQDYGQELRPVRGLNQLWGFVDETGKEVIPFKYQAAQEFSEGLVAVRLNKLWGFIDKTGTVIIPILYLNVGKFSEGIVRVYTEVNINDWFTNRWVFIDKNRKQVIPNVYEDAGDFSEGLARVRHNKKWGFINNLGTPIISFIYDDASDFSDGLAQVRIKRNWGFIDKTGKEVFKNETINETNEPQAVKSNETNSSSSKRQSVTNCAKNTAFGLDIGLGGSFYKSGKEKDITLLTTALGIRVMHHFNPYFGVDFSKINWITDVLTYRHNTAWKMRLQIMSGIRGNTPVFSKCMSGYAAFRLGYGMDFGESNFEGLCLETEAGLNLTRTVFVGFAYNYHKYFVEGIDARVAMHALSFRLGFNF